MKRYSVLFCLLLELCVNPCLAQSEKTAPGETVVQSFILLRAGASVKISWQTSAEKNNNYFEILRSADGEHFTTMALVFAREQAEHGADYLYTDNTIAQSGADILYYRIRQVSMDGTFTVTETRKFRVGDQRTSPR
jgi:hypothetical protein